MFPAAKDRDEYVHTEAAMSVYVYERKIAFRNWKILLRCFVGYNHINC